MHGQGRYPNAARLMITADAGGSNSDRSRNFKGELAALTATIGLMVTVCHTPRHLEAEQDRASTPVVG